MPQPITVLENSVYVKTYHYAQVIILAYFINSLKRAKVYHVLHPEHQQERLNELTDFHEIWYEYHSIGDLFTTYIILFSHRTLTWRQCELICGAALANPVPGSEML
jgi:hypothetical protein